MSCPRKDDFKWQQYKGKLILLCVRWYLAFTLSYRQLERMLREQSWSVDHTSIFRWIQHYGKVKGKDLYLYRTVDSSGQAIDFLLTAQQDKASAKRFFRKALSGSHNPSPRVIKVDKNRAYPVAVEELKAEGVLSCRCRLRHCKFLNNIVEQDHRNSKKRTCLAKGYKTFPSARRTLEGIETMQMIRKGRVRRVTKKNVVAEAKFIAMLFGIAA